MPVKPTTLQLAGISLDLSQEHAMLVAEGTGLGAIALDPSQATWNGHRYDTRSVVTYNDKLCASSPIPNDVSDLVRGSIRR